MPDDPAEDDFQLTAPSGSERVLLPPVSPPSTKAPFQFNQQINIQQIPPKAWDKLSPDQIVELSKVIVAQIEKSDERQYNWAMTQAKNAVTAQTRALLIGGVVALGGVAATTYLSMAGHQLVAAILGTFLATLVAVVVGNHFIE